MTNYIGAHISKESTILKTLKYIDINEGNSLQIFVSSPMNSQLPDLNKIVKESNNIIKFINENNFKLVVHGSYVINLANNRQTNTKRTIDIKDRWWINLLIKELDASEILNSIGVIVHVGKHTTNTKEDGINIMYDSIKYIINYLKENNYKTKLILETPAGSGNELLTTFNEFVDFYNKFTLNDKKHFGICLDTAHIWSSGYELTEYYNNISSIHDNISVIHLNNSKVKKGSKVDRHDVIDRGLINKKDIELFLNKLEGNPIIILETPDINYKEEIKWIKKNLQLNKKND